MKRVEGTQSQNSSRKYKSKEAEEHTKVKRVEGTQSQNSSRKYKSKVAERG